MTQTPWNVWLDKVSKNLMYPVTAFEQDFIEIISKRMQERYPGPYALTYWGEHGQVKFYPHFQDPEEEILWMLRWG
jgi:hypothetical protein